MGSQERHINVTVKARYYTFGNLTSKTEKVWFVMHGYGQLARYFIRKFEILDPEKNYIIAPEGLNRFYLEGFSGRIGATWMTREDRITDIKNYVTFLTDIYNSLLSDIPTTAEINMLGFSQGAATVCRWLGEGNIHYDKLILWAGIFPPDLQIEKASKVLASKPAIVVLGKDDEYITEERMAELASVTEDLNLSPKLIHYEGGHSIHGETLKKLSINSY